MCNALTKTKLWTMQSFKLPIQDRCNSDEEPPILLQKLKKSLKILKKYFLQQGN